MALQVEQNQFFIGRKKLDGKVQPLTLFEDQLVFGSYYPTEEIARDRLDRVHQRYPRASDIDVYRVVAFDAEKVE